MALALTPTRGEYRKLDTVENCSWIGNCIQTALVRGIRGGREKVSIEDEILRTTTLEATAASANVHIYNGTQTIRANVEVQSPFTLTFALWAKLMQPTHSARVYKKMHNAYTHVSHK